jgi:CDP-glucose 4,6-dehydratase
MENMEISSLNFWRGKRVFITGHTGFKGGWLSIWLSSLGAKVGGYSLPPNEGQLFYAATNLKDLVTSYEGDISNFDHLQNAIRSFNPDIVFHLAAQSLVRESYKSPLNTYLTNVMGTANILEACRTLQNLRAIVNVTTDKCYENKEWVWGYRETDGLGGMDPYSSSKACSELVSASYRDSFLSKDNGNQLPISLATARAGNVIGGGDRAEDRIIPDMVSALIKGQNCSIRNPDSIRPWQHVLDPLRGYMILAERMYEFGSEYAEPWNFGPNSRDSRSVGYLAAKFVELWGAEGVTSFGIDGKSEKQPHEAHTLSLDSTKANLLLGWSTALDTDDALAYTVEWEKRYLSGEMARDITFEQIDAYQKIAWISGQN